MQAFLSVPLVSTPAHPLASGGRDGDSGRMTSSTIFRGGHTSEASDLVAPAGAGVSRPGSDGPSSRAERERHWWQRLRRFLSPQQPPHELQQAVLERMLALLESARAEVSAGWVQGGWWTTSAGGNRQRWREAMNELGKAKVLDDDRIGAGFSDCSDELERFV